MRTLRPVKGSLRDSKQITLKVLVQVCVSGFFAFWSSNKEMGLGGFVSASNIMLTYVDC